ncbi:signal peptide peptidase-domain-containing protein [Pelagophyceae sp. CCMP2097]|nr:signal peptide peptidase-domain-containing protein [Pelagophyceae sp. CCMP2097]
MLKVSVCIAVCAGFQVRPLRLAAPRARALGERAAAPRAPAAAPAAGPSLQNPIVADLPAYAAAVSVQAIPVLFDDKAAHYVFFLSLATLTVYLSARAPTLVPPETKPLTLEAALLAPVFASASLGALYACITVLHVDPSQVYRVLTSAFATVAAAVLFDDTLDAVHVWRGGDEADEADAADASAPAPAAAALAVAVAAAYLAGVGNGVAVSNFLAWSLALLAVRTVPLKSFRVGATLLAGLFFYDIFFVFGSDIMVTVARTIDAPVKLVAPNAPGALNAQAILGLGDVAIPALLVGFLARYGAMRGDAIWLRNGVAAYAVGLSAAFYANEFIRSGQPALLYLVPAIVGSGVATALFVDGSPAPLFEYQEDETPR